MRQMVALLLILAVPILVAKEKKPKKPKVVYTPTYANSRVYQTTCDSVWGLLVPAITEMGFAVASSDKQLGTVTLGWTRGYSQYPASQNDVKTLSRAPTGFFYMWTAFGVSSASATILPEDNGCRCTFRIAYAGFRETFDKGWFMLESNNALEERILNEIEQRLSVKQTQGTATHMPQSNLDNPSEAAKLTVTVTPPTAEIEVDGKFVGNSPSTVSVKPGKTSVVVKKDGWVPWSKVVETSAGSAVTLVVELERLSLKP